MRNICSLFIVIFVAALSVRSDTISISGYLRNPENIEVESMECKVMNDLPKQEKTKATINERITVDPSGLYRFDYYKDDYELINDKWHIDCETFVKVDENLQLYKKYSAWNLEPAKFESSPRIIGAGTVQISIYYAVIQDLILNSEQDDNPSTTQTSSMPKISNTNVAALKMQDIGIIPEAITLEENFPQTNNCYYVPVSRKIAERAARLQYKSKYGEMTEAEANEELRKQTVQILARTPLGVNETETIEKIHEEIIRNYGNNIQLLPVIKEKEQFKDLRKREDFKKTRDENNKKKININANLLSDNFTVLRSKYSFLKSSKQIGLIQHKFSEIVLIDFNEATTYKICASVNGAAKTTCTDELITGKNWEEVRDTGLKQLCRNNENCIKLAKSNFNNVKIYKNDKLIITHLSF